MTSGGARNRSGPQADPRSGRSDSRGVSYVALPAAGFDGEAPAWPLPRRAVFFESVVDGKIVREFDQAATEAVADRELVLWAWAWSTPQAWAWSQPAEAWRLMTIAMWVRTYVVCESSDAKAADKASLHRFADQIGITPAGLKENGWQVVAGPVAVAPTPAQGEAPRRERRLRAAT